MKNQSITTPFAKGFVRLLIIATSLMVMSFINIKDTANSYHIISSKIFIEGTGKLAALKVKVDNGNIEGKFSTEDGELDDIKDFRFSFPTNQFNSLNQQEAETLKTLFDGEITFVQKRLMILPIMKMVHLVGEIKIGNNTHAVPMQIQYIANEDGGITLYGKQFVKLSEFGITLPNAKPSDVEEEITINITLKLSKQQPVFAKLVNH